MTKHFRLPSMAAVVALALASGFTAVAPAAAQDQGPASLGGAGATTAVPALPPFARTRAILQAQNAQTLGRSAPTTGAESGKVYENYLASIGKGGAGPKVQGLADTSTK